MPGPQTQHKGTVYGDDENAPKLTYLLTYLLVGLSVVSGEEEQRTGYKYK